MIRITGSNGLLMTSLDALNGSDQTDSSARLTEALLTKDSSKSSASSLTGASASKYKGLQELAGKLKTLSDLLSDTSDSSVFAAAKASGDNSTATSCIKEFADRYNSLLQSLDKLDSTAAPGYSAELSAITSSYKEQLAEVGISVSGGGRLSINEDALTETSLDKLTALFSGSSCFAGQISEKGIYIGASAAANAYLNMAGATGSYNSSGIDYGQLSSVVGNYLNSIG